MPALRALKTDEEIAAIPLDQPILVELPSGVIADEPEIDPDKDKKTRANETDDAAKTLQDQLTALKAEKAASDARADKNAQEAAEARRVATERDAELRQARTQSVSAEESNIQSTLQAAQDAMAAAEAELERAGQDGDFKAMGKAQAKIGRTAADIRNLEIAAADVAQRREEEAKRPEPQPLRQAIDPIAAIDANPNLLATEKDWLKAHSDAVLDQNRNNELGVAYQRAVKKDLVRGTPAYFAFLEEFMGYSKPQTNDDQTDERDISVQAPPSRNDRGNDGRPSGNRVTLTPEQREIARSLGVSDIEYARQVVNFDAARKADPDKYR